MIALRQSERAKTQMTLGSFITRLKQLDQSLRMKGLYAPHCDCQYGDIAFMRFSDNPKVSKVLQMVSDCKGRTFGGYGGGNYKMGKDTPVWIVDGNCIYTRLMSVGDDGTLVTAHEDEV